MEYLLVSFEEARDVLANGQPHGRTNTIVQFAAGTYTITLGGPTDFTPPECEVRLQNTAPLDPCLVQFQRVITATATPAPGPPA